MLLFQAAGKITKLSCCRGTARLSAEIVSTDAQLCEQSHFEKKRAISERPRKSLAAIRQTIIAYPLSISGL